jgi:hypothetical protein
MSNENETRAPKLPTTGTYKARASGECVLGASKAKGTPFLEFYLTIIGGEHAGQRVRWTGYFTENTNERTIQSIQICGWAGEDISEFSDGSLHGLDSNEVEIVVEHEDYTNDQGEAKTVARVAWINRAGGFLNVKAAMRPNEAQSFGERMRGLVLKMKEKNGVQGDTSFDHGANAPHASPAGAPPKKAF